MVFKNWLLALMLMFSLRLMLMFLILHKTRLRLIDYVFFIFVADEYFNKSNCYSTSYSINSMTQFLLLIKIIAAMFKILRPSLNTPLLNKTISRFSFKKRLMEYAAKRSQEEAKLRNPTPSDSQYDKQQQTLSQQQKRIISAYKVDPLWNLITKQAPDRNFQKDLIIYKKQFEKTTKELRSSILFQDLLKTQIDILIYDTKGSPFIHHFLKILYMLASAAAAIWSMYALRQYDPKNGVLLDKTTQGRVYKYCIYAISAIIVLSAFSKHGSYRNKYVEKIIYNTEKEEFTFTKRNFLGFKYNYIASRFKILYTENVFLNRAGTNYFDIDTKEEFSIAYRESWVKQDLFSHLIAQRIKV